jgi:hypothetical protein
VALKTLLKEGRNNVTGPSSVVVNPSRFSNFSGKVVSQAPPIGAGNRNRLTACTAQAMSAGS